MELEEPFEVDKVAEDLYRSRHNLSKPHPSLRGVYGGNLAAQALLVAIRSAPAGFVPHSLHSYFVKAGLADRHFDWHVERISDGKSFCNRILKAVQNGDIKYIANISLTTKNSKRDSQKAYEEYKHKNANVAEEEIDETRAVAKPFGFGKPYPDWLTKHDPSELKVNPRIDNRHLSHLLPPEMTDLGLTVYEDKLDVTDRQLAFYVKWGTHDGREIKVPHLDEFRYTGLAFVSDSLFLTRLARILRIPNLDHGGIRQYFLVSLDHIIYFHDSDFDPTEWMGFSFNVVNFSNDRALIEGEMYTRDGRHVATVVQEGMVKLGKLAEVAKL